MEETFRIIKDFENYSISNLGRLRNNKTDKILKPQLNTHGYYFVTLCSDGNKYQKLIHKLVGELFIPNPLNKSCIDHKNNIRLDNNVTNLRWAHRIRY